MKTELIAVEPFGAEADLEAILSIDAASFSRPWTRAMYEDDLRDRERTVILVARTGDGAVAGYCACWIVADELHINNVAVHPDARRRGIGRALVSAALETGRQRGAGRAWLEVRAANLAGRELYRSLGFGEVTIRRGYYADPADDGVVMAAEIQSFGLNPGS